MSTTYSIDSIKLASQINDLYMKAKKSFTEEDGDKARQLVTLQDFCQFSKETNASISIPTLYAWVKKGLLPPIQYRRSNIDSRVRVAVYSLFELPKVSLIKDLKVKGLGINKIHSIIKIFEFYEEVKQ